MAAINLPADHADAGPTQGMEEDLLQHATTVFDLENVKKHLKKSGPPKVLFKVMHADERIVVYVITHASPCDPQNSYHKKFALALRNFGAPLKKTLVDYLKVIIPTYNHACIYSTNHVNTLSPCF